MNDSISLKQLSFYLGIFISFMAMGFYIYPINSLGAWGGPNTKQVLAVIGLLLFIFKTFRDKKGVIPLQLLFATMIAFIYSIVCYISTEVNTTSDYTYAEYFISFFTWLLSSLTVAEVIRWIHGEFNLRLITNYLLATAVFQCIMALLIDNVPAIEYFVDSYLLDDNYLFAKSLDRLYGVGASLDTAGIRMAITYMLASFILTSDPEIYEIKKRYNWYIFSMFIILIVGNMIARTTITGVMIGIGIMIYNFSFPKSHTASTLLKPISLSLLGYTLIFTIASTILYYANSDFQKLLEYGFEGFFNLFNEGKWRTGSTDILKTLWVWPTDLQGWVIGYGSFSWNFVTDIGYCRFTLYSGLIGISLFILLFSYQLIGFGESMPKYRLLMWALLLIQLIIWIKVSTDIFFIMALFYWLDELSQKKEVISIVNQ